MLTVLVSGKALTAGFCGQLTHGWRLAAQVFGVSGQTLRVVEVVRSLIDSES